MLLTLVAATGRADDVLRTANAKYLGVNIWPAGGRVADLNPLAHLYACFDISGEMVIGKWFSWTWDDTFRRVKYRSMAKVRYDAKHIWVTLPTGKEVRLEKDLSNPRIVEDCKRNIALSN